MLKRPETFADAVDDYVHRVLNNKPLEPSYPHQVEQLGSALALIWSLIDCHRQAFPLDAKGIAALRVFDELRSGRGDLIWSYIDDVRTSRRIPKRPPQGDLVEGLRCIVAAAVRVYAKIEGISQTAARDQLVELAELSALGFSTNQIKHWARKADPDLVDRFAAVLEQQRYDGPGLIKRVRWHAAKQLKPAS
jgi:hypothetical protein